jgi:hypothetical protein
MCETEQLFWEFAVRTAKSVRALLSVIGRISVVTRQIVRSYRVQQCRGSIGPITHGTHGRTPHGRAPHRRVPHGRTPHRRVSLWTCIFQIPHLTNGGAVVDLSRSELQNSVGAGVRLARRMHAQLGVPPIRPRVGPSDPSRVLLGSVSVAIPVS